MKALYPETNVSVKPKPVKARESYSVAYVADGVNFLLYCEVGRFSKSTVLKRSSGSVHLEGTKIVHSTSARLSRPKLTWIGTKLANL